MGTRLDWVRFGHGDTNMNVMEPPQGQPEMFVPNMAVGQAEPIEASSLTGRVSKSTPPTSKSNAPLPKLEHPQEQSEMPVPNTAVGQAEPTETSGLTGGIVFY